MKSASLLLLRLSIGLLVLLWGIDKLVDPGHAIAVSENFYLGLLSIPWLLTILGVAQIAVATLALVGLFRAWVDPLIALINLGSLLGVWRSIVDPWGWFLEGTNVLFFPSLAIFAGCLVLIAFRADERYVLDARRAPSALPSG